MDHQQSHEIIAFAVKAARMTEDLLKEILKSFGKGIAKHGKQSLNSLAQEGGALQNIEVTSQNIKSFDATARKYDIDYAIKKDSSQEPPLYFVFFKGKDIKTMEKAFSEYTYVSVNQKASVKQKINEVQKTQHQDQNRERNREKNKDRGMEI